MSKLKAFLFKRKKKNKIKPEELWDLDITIVEWLLPRMKAFKEQTDGYPGNITWNQWMSILDRIITGLEAYVEEYDWDDNLSTEKNLKLDADFSHIRTAKFQEAMQLLTKHFSNLWW